MSLAIHPSPSRQHGFSLIEVLVTVVVLSIGLLSLAAGQAMSLRNNTSALMRFQATNLAYDILDRMRANRTSAIQGDYSLAMAASPGSGTDMASQDLVAWRASLASNLPNGNGAVVQNGREVTITVQWSESTRQGQTPMTFSFRTVL
jgi:type IV pilus assembly protein PilV